MSENDPQLELKKRARRRLVGAAALAVLAAIVLPMVMDQSPKQQPAQDIDIRIPSQQDAGVFNARVTPAKPVSAPETKTPEPPTPEAKPESAKPEPAKPKVSPDSTASKPPAAESKPNGKPNGKPSDKSSDKPAPKKTEAAAPAASGAGHWIVQLGAYQNEANVRNLTAKIKEQGYNVYTESLPFPDGSARTRVRAGPFPSKEAAEKARDRIKRLGVEGSVAQQ